MSRPKGSPNKEVKVPEVVLLSEEEKLNIAAELILELIVKEQEQCKVI